MGEFYYTSVRLFSSPSWAKLWTQFSYAAVWVISAEHSTAPRSRVGLHKTARNGRKNHEKPAFFFRREAAGELSPTRERGAGNESVSYAFPGRTAYNIAQSKRCFHSYAQRGEAKRVIAEEQSSTPYVGGIGPQSAESSL